MAYKCTDCGEEFENECDLGVHVMYDVHMLAEDNFDSYGCEICDEVFEHESDLQIHILFGHGKCELTGKELEDYEKAINDPTFAPLIKAIDEKAREFA